MKIQPINYSRYTSFASTKNKKTKQVKPNSNKQTPKAHKTICRPLIIAGIVSANILLTSDCIQNEQVWGSYIESSTVDQYETIEEDLKGIRTALLEQGENLTYESTVSAIEDFLKSKNIRNITVDDINNPKDKSRRYTLKMKKALAAFWSVPDWYMNFHEGTLYISKPGDMKDKKARITYVEEVVHELSHALQAKNDTTRQGLYGITNNLGDMELIDDYLNVEIGDNQEILFGVNTVRSCGMYLHIMANADKLNPEQIFEDEKKYGITYCEDAIEIDKEIIENGISDFIKNYYEVKGEPFEATNLEETVNYYADLTLNDFIEKNKPLTKEKENKLKKALLSRIIYVYNGEKEAYEMGCETIKEGLKIPKGKQILMDYIPETYEMIVDILEDKMEREYK